MEDGDLRRTPRYPLIVDVEMTDMQSGIQIRARTTTLSVCGCGVRSSKLFPQGARIGIQFSYHGAEARVLGRVVYSRPDLGMGVAFTSVEREDQRVLEWWIAEHLSVPVPE